MRAQIYIMKIEELINYRGLSRRLSGNNTSIRSNNIADIYKEDVEDLIKMLTRWDNERLAKKAIRAAQKPSENETEQANAQEEIVQAKEIEARMPAEISDEDKKPLFRAIPKLKNIYENGRCYRVGNEKGNMHYYKTIEDALWFTK